jgi:AraC family transcriptional regulator
MASELPTFVPSPMREATAIDYKQRITRVLVHLEARLDDSHSLEELAELAAFSPYHFHRVFRAIVGETLGDHLRRLRLERAARQLSTTRRTVTRIAVDAGYESLEAFSRAFHSALGASPSRFRKQRQPPRDVVRRMAMPTTTAPIDVHLRYVPPTPLVFVRHVGPYTDVSSAWQRLFTWAGMRGHLSRPFRMIGVPHDDPRLTDAGHVRYDACLAFDAGGSGLEPQGDIGVQEIGGGEYAVIEHRGAYEGLDDTYQYLFGEWLPASGREPADRPAFEVYLNSPRDTAPADLRTEVHLPLQPVGRSRHANR